MAGGTVYARGQWASSAYAPPLRPGWSPGSAGGPGRRSGWDLGGLRLHVGHRGLLSPEKRQAQLHVGLHLLDRRADRCVRVHARVYIQHMRRSRGGYLSPLSLSLSPPAPLPLTRTHISRGEAGERGLPLRGMHPWELPQLKVLYHGD